MGLQANIPGPHMVGLSSHVCTYLQLRTVRNLGDWGLSMDFQLPGFSFPWQVSVSGWGSLEESNSCVVEFGYPLVIKPWVWWKIHH